MTKLNLYIIAISVYLVSLFVGNLANALTIDINKLFQSKITNQIAIPASYTTYKIKNEKELIQAVSNAHKIGGFSAIYLSDGIYHLKNTLNITAPNIMLLSSSGNPYKTVLRGNGMKATQEVDNLVRVTAANFVLDGITLEQAGNHLLQIAGEFGATKPIIRNSIFQDGYEQLLKVTYSRKNLAKFSRHGVIENSLFRYSSSVGPNYYIGGIDAHGIQEWTIKNNLFANIASPSKHIAEHAIHLWNDTKNNQVINNTIINSDRGIGFGMKQKKTGYVNYSNLGGFITGNIIYHAENKHLFADASIILEDSPETQVVSNLIHMEHQYPNAIEFRFSSTRNVLIKNNFTNKRITTRNGGKGLIIGNEISNESLIEIKNKLAGYIIN